MSFAANGKGSSISQSSPVVVSDSIRAQTQQLPSHSLGAPAESPSQTTDKAKGVKSVRGAQDRARAHSDPGQGAWSNSAAMLALGQQKKNKNGMAILARLKKLGRGNAFNAGVPLPRNTSGAKTPSALEAVPAMAAPVSTRPVPAQGAAPISEVEILSPGFAPFQPASESGARPRSRSVPRALSRSISTTERRSPEPPASTPAAPQTPPQSRPALSSPSPSPSSSPEPGEAKATPMSTPQRLRRRQVTPITPGTPVEFKTSSELPPVPADVALSQRSILRFTSPATTRSRALSEGSGEITIPLLKDPAARERHIQVMIAAFAERKEAWRGWTEANRQEAIITVLASCLQRELHREFALSMSVQKITEEFSVWNLRGYFLAAVMVGVDQQVYEPARRLRGVWRHLDSYQRKSIYADAVLRIRRFCKDNAALWQRMSSAKQAHCAKVATYAALVAVVGNDIPLPLSYHNAFRQRGIGWLCEELNPSVRPYIDYIESMLTDSNLNGLTSGLNLVLAMVNDILVESKESPEAKCLAVTKVSTASKAAGSAEIQSAEAHPLDSVMVNEPLKKAIVQRLVGSYAGELEHWERSFAIAIEVACFADFPQARQRSYSETDAATSVGSPSALQQYLDFRALFEAWPKREAFVAEIKAMVSQKICLPQASPSPEPTPRSVAAEQLPPQQRVAELARSLPGYLRPSKVAGIFREGAGDQLDLMSPSP